MNFILGRMTMSAMADGKLYRARIGDNEASMTTPPGTIKRRSRKPGGRAARYMVSLPERVLRSAAALAGGLIRELGDVALPAAVRRTKSYQMMVEIALRFLLEQVGEVKGVFPAEGKLANNFLIRRTAGHGLELAG